MAKFGYKFPIGNQTNKGRIPWNKGIRRIEATVKKCEKCFVTFNRSSNMGDKQWLKQKFCSKSCVQKGNKTNLGRKHSQKTIAKMKLSHPKGEKSPFWIIDRTQIKSNKDRHWGSTEYTEWRTKVFARDGFKCKMLTKECSSYVEAHHILSWRDYPELRYQTNNGITLCRAHHPRKRAEEKRLAPIFQELVSVSN